MTASLTRTASAPASSARTTIGSAPLVSATNSVDSPGPEPPMASPTACAPSTRNSRSRSRNARFLSLTASAIRGLRTDVMTGPLTAWPGRLLRGPSNDLDQIAEGLWVVDRDVGEDLAVELHARLLQPVHER